jgi:molybdate transport system substrate-binding protein
MRNAWAKIHCDSSMKSFCCAIVLTALCGSGPVDAAEIAVAAASDLNFAFKELVAEYERTTGRHVRLSLGSSGNFYSQIQNGAPFDLYFSADVRYPHKLEESGHAVPGTLYKYAVGRIVLWAPKGSAVDVQKGLTALLDPAVKKIAIANPKHAPYGRAAVAAMEHFQVYERVKGKLVLGENISQAAQFVESGAAEVGVVALSLALAPAMKAAGQHWEVPLDSYPPLEQGAVLLKNGTNPEGAKAFLAYVQGAKGRAIMRRYGFIIPGESMQP